MFSFKFTCLYDFVTQHTTNLFITFVFKLKVDSEEFNNLDVLCVDTDHFWDKLCELLDFLFSNDGLFIEVITVNLDDFGQ